MKRIIAIVLLSLASPWSALAAKPIDGGAELKSAQAALASGDYQTAYARYLRMEKRNPLSQFMIGLFHQNGWGRAKSPATACVWFEKAAQKHVPTAEHYWGDCLAQGIGRAADVPAALAWYDQAASHGHLISWCAAADYYIQGKGVEKDVAKGIDLCVQAARANSPPAMLKLARYYQDDRDVPQNLAAARGWYQEAAQRHVGEAQYRLGLMLARGEGGEPDLNAALFWLETAASEGYALAYLPTAQLYANAPLVADTGVLAPEHLAKVYLWTSAAKARAGDGSQLAEAEKLAAQVLAVMPAAWRPDLDKQVAMHVAKYSD